MENGARRSGEESGGKRHGNEARSVVYTGKFVINEQ